ncbi:MAG: ABC transporter substrate-binding protein [Saprospirales bacterium]|nr:MAG: ABC transporter substrate-binding protein [Saprospirales bacterium]
MKIPLTILLLLLLTSCVTSPKEGVYTIGFLDAVEDSTLGLARKGFQDALEERGYSKKDNNLEILFRNAQGDMNTLIQSLQFFTTRGVDLIAANSTLSTISAVQRSGDIPVCMMVAPEPYMAGLTDSEGNNPKNLFGVYETLNYIDTSVQMILEWLPDVTTIGLVYNQAETQSLNALERIKQTANRLGIEVFALPVTNSSETQLVTQSLIEREIDVFFAMPDNIIFSSFEVILRLCNRAEIPVFSSESGLVARGAVAAFGADFYSWGHQAGLLAADFFDSNKSDLPPIQEVIVRNKIYNPEAVSNLGLDIPKGFQAFIN